LKQTLIKKDGKLDIDKDVMWMWVETYIARYKDGSRFDWSLTLKRRTKSDPQRALYFAEILPKFMEAVGYDPHEALDTHRFLKIRWFEPQAHLLEKFGLKPIVKDKHGYYHNVPHLFGDKSVIPVDIRTKFMNWVGRIAAEYGAEF
jgi:hypothetical protein